MIYNYAKNYAKKKDNLAQHAPSDFFVLTHSGEVLRQREVVPGGAQKLGRSERRFISTEELREGIAGDWQILTNVVEAEACAVVARKIKDEVLKWK